MPLFGDFPVDKDVIRLVKCRCLKDHDCITHHMVKGQEYELQSDHAESLSAQGIVEVRPQANQAVRSTAGAERRG